MSLQDIVNVTISKQTASVSRAGFGTPLIMSTEADALLADTAKTYGPNLSELTADGFDAAGSTAIAFTKLISQNPKVSQIVVGKRATAPLKTIDIVPVIANDTLYRVTINGTNFDFTSTGSADAQEIIDGLLALINAGAHDVVASNVGPDTSLKIEKAATPGGVATAGVPFTISTDRTLLPRQNITADPGIVADVTAVRTAIDGNDDWYAVVLDNDGLAEITSLAVYVETLRKIFVAATSDADVITSAVDDVASVLQGLSYARTAIIWHEDADTFPNAAWIGNMLPRDAGSATWAYKTLTGITASTLTTAEENFLIAKGANRHVTVAGNNVTLDGVMSGGEYIDITRGIDFITARLEENVFGQLVNLPKIPYTDPGIAVVENEVRGVLNLGISQGILAADPEPTVTVPKAADVDSTDKANRLLPDVNFTGTLAGAIHTVEINGIVTV